MKKILGGFLCICAFFAVCLFVTDKEVAKEETTAESKSQTALLKKDLDLGDLDGGEDEGIILLTDFIG